MQLVNETSAHRYGVSLQDWQVSLIWSFIVSIFCIGGLLGSLVASPLVTSFGRWVSGAGWDSALLLFFDDALTALQETMLSAEQLCDHHWSCADAPQHNRQVLRDDHGGAVYLRHQRRWGWGNGLRLFSSRVFSSLIPSLMGFAITLGPPPLHLFIRPSLFHLLISHRLRLFLPRLRLQESAFPFTAYTLSSAPPRGCGGWWASPSRPLPPLGSSSLSCWGSGELSPTPPESQVWGQVEARSKVSWHVGVAKIVSFWRVNTRAYFCSIINKSGRYIHIAGNTGGVLDCLKSN